MRRAAAGRAGAGASGTELSSSSNGVSKRSDMASASRGNLRGERVDFLGRESQTLDRRRLAARAIGGDDDGVQAPGTCRGFELRRHAGDEAGESELRRD